MARLKSFDEGAVLERAVQLFWRRGYEGTSLADLEEHLGLGRQSLYNTYGDKRTLFLKALDHYRRNVGESALARLSDGEAGLAAIRNYLHWAVDSLTAPGPRSGCFVTNTITECASEDTDALLRCNQSRDSLERAFRRALVQAKERGEVARGLDIEATATLLVVQNYGLNVLTKTGASADELHAAVEALAAGLK
jgi:TetR/AcrR family transcriptional repressor of nem operon